LLFINSNSYAQATLLQREDRAMKAVEALPEMKKFFRSLKTKDTSVHIALMVSRDPDSSFKYFWVKVGVDNAYMFTTIHHFYVTPGTYEVRYLDVASDSLLTLKQWRARNAHKK